MPITEGKGRKMLEKMGWKEGQGVGKHKEGPVEPLALDIKTNRRGLVSQDDNKPGKDAVMFQMCGN